MNLVSNPLPEAGIAEYPPRVPFMHAERGDLLYDLKKSVSSVILNFIAKDRYGGNVVPVMGEYGSGKTKLAFSIMRELNCLNYSESIADQSLILASADTEEYKKQIMDLIYQETGSQILTLYLTFTQAFMEEFTQANIISLFRSILSEISTPTQPPNQYEQNKFRADLITEINSMEISRLTVDQILLLLKKYYRRILIFLDEFEGIEERPEPEITSIMESIKNDFINAFEGSDYGTLLFILYTPAVERLITQAIFRRGRPFEIGNFTYLTAKRVIERYLQGTSLYEMLGDQMIFSTFHLSRDAGSQFLQVCHDALIRSQREGRTRVDYTDVLLALRGVRDQQGRPMFSTACYYDLIGKLKAKDEDNRTLFDCYLGQYYPMSKQEISATTGIPQRRVEKISKEFATADLFDSIGPIVVRCFFLPKIELKTNRVAEAVGITPEVLLESLDKLAQLHISDQIEYIVPESYHGFETRLRDQAFPELHKELLSTSHESNKYMLSTRVLRYLIASPVGYEDVLNLLKGKLRAQIRGELTGMTTYERERSLREGMFVLQKFLEGA